MATIKITYSVKHGLMTFTTWAAALDFANRVNGQIILVTATNGISKIETGYSVDTWKNAKQIKNDIIQQF